MNGMTSSSQMSSPSALTEWYCSIWASPSTSWMGRATRPQLSSKLSPEPAMRCTVPACLSASLVLHSSWASQRPKRRL
eukprot:1460503-Pyramimonas_sp.AAC.1